MNRVLEARGIAKRYGDLEVLRDVSFALNERESVALLGPSGCGKTTLLRILLGLEAPDNGTTGSPLDHAGYLPQEGLLFPWKTVMQNAELPQQIRGASRPSRRHAVREMLPEFELEAFAKAYPYQLSGGMRQRAALLRAVMTGSPVLLLDEPFGALDTLTRHRMQDWLAGLLARLERAMLFVTHDLDEAVALSRRVVLLSERPGSVCGEVPINLTPAERRRRAGRPFVERRDQLLAHILEGSDG